MTKVLVFRASPREYVLLMLGTLGILIHVADEVFNVGEEIAPPVIPLLMTTTVFVLLPTLARALATIVFGGIFAIAQINGHFIPILENGPSAGNGDYSAVFSEVGGILLIILGIRLLRRWKSTASKGKQSSALQYHT